MSDYEVALQKSPVFFDRYMRKDESQHQTHYCPGCGHGVVHKMVADALCELGMQDHAILVSPVGCSVFAYYYFDVGNIQAAHGRAPAVATAAKRTHPNSVVISYQGDGDLAAIGTAEIIHAANRGEKITVIFINNSIYGMTGGQMAPTTLVGQESTTTPWGRRANNDGFPIHMSELLATLEAPAYIERVSLCDTKNVLKARKAVKKALQMQSVGFSFVEILSPCPTILKMDPMTARKWVEEILTKQFPLGLFRDRNPEIPSVEVPQKSVAELLEIGEHAPVAQEKAACSSRVKDITLKIAGFGGQGVLLFGQLIAMSGMREHMEVSWLPSYGPEMRSGSAHCHVALSRNRIGSPLVSRPQVLVAMNEPSLRRFTPTLAEDGLILYNGNQPPTDFDATGLNMICVPASEIGDKVGSPKVANVVMLGALLEYTDCLPRETVFHVLTETVKDPKMLALNKKAMEAGRKFIDQTMLATAVAGPDGYSTVE